MDGIVEHLMDGKSENTESESRTFIVNGERWSAVHIPDHIDDADVLTTKSNKYIPVKKGLVRDLGYIEMKNNEGPHKLYYEEIYYIIKVGNYMCFRFKKRKKMYFKTTLDDLLALLRAQFCKANRSVIVNVFEITTLDTKRDGDLVMSNNESFPVGGGCLEELLDKFNSRIM